MVFLMSFSIRFYLIVRVIDFFTGLMDYSYYSSPHATFKISPQHNTGRGLSLSPLYTLLELNSAFMRSVLSPDYFVVKALQQERPCPVHDSEKELIINSIVGHSLTVPLSYH